MFKLTLIIVFALVLFVVGPIATIWSLNTLFPVLVIPYTFYTWLATFILFAGVSGLKFSSK